MYVRSFCLIFAWLYRRFELGSQDEVGGIYWISSSLGRIADFHPQFNKILRLRFFDSFKLEFQKFYYKSPLLGPYMYVIMHIFIYHYYIDSQTYKNQSSCLYLIMIKFFYKAVKFMRILHKSFIIISLFLENMKLLNYDVDN